MRIIEHSHSHSPKFHSDSPKVSFTFQILSNINISSFIQILQSFKVVQHIYEQKHKGTVGIIEIENPNLVKAKNVKAKDVDELLRYIFADGEENRTLKERKELEKQKAHERYMRLQEQGKTKQAKKDLDLCITKGSRKLSAKGNGDTK
ncbi:unnamed protein product [Lupinus luteus]|uniref:Casein kinase substrate phosphoprotein PP28 domain-containing protein n=1 Tax=Lupinus luteus TaxID=3873 RepID=A0AAV1W730_LUPLU